MAQGLLAHIAGDAPDLHWHADMALPDSLDVDEAAITAVMRAMGLWATAIGAEGFASIGVWRGYEDIGDEPGSVVLQAGRRHQHHEPPRTVAEDDTLAAIASAAAALPGARMTAGIEDQTERVTIWLPDLLAKDAEAAHPWGSAFERYRLLFVRRPILTPARLERSMALTALDAEFVADLDAAAARIAERWAVGEPFDFIALSAAAFPGELDRVLERLRGTDGGWQARIVLTGAPAAMRVHPLADQVLVAGESAQRLLDAVFDLIRQPQGLDKAVEEVPSLIGHHILIVEDVAMNRALLQAMLSPTGATLSLADDGEGAIEAMRTRPADIVLMDIMMPRMDGLEA
ncbi:MAG: response regulator, partial [Pseudomonadota bacterium]